MFSWDWYSEPELCSALHQSELSILLSTNHSSPGHLPGRRHAGHGARGAVAVTEGAAAGLPAPAPAPAPAPCSALLARGQVETRSSVHLHNSSGGQ